MKWNETGQEGGGQNQRAMTNERGNCNLTSADEEETSEDRECGCVS